MLMPGLGRPQDILHLHAAIRSALESFADSARALLAAGPGGGNGRALETLVERHRCCIVLPGLGGAALVASSCLKGAPMNSACHAAVSERLARVRRRLDFAVNLGRSVEERGHFAMSSAGPRAGSCGRCACATVPARRRCCCPRHGASAPPLTPPEPRCKCGLPPPPPPHQRARTHTHTHTCLTSASCPSITIYTLHELLSGFPEVVAGCPALVIC